MWMLPLRIGAARLKHFMENFEKHLIRIRASLLRK